MNVCCFSEGARAQEPEPRTFRYRPDKFPPALTLKRGDILYLEGPGLRAGEPQTFVLRAGEQIRARITTAGHWQLRYDTRTESYPACVMTLWQQVNGAMTLRTRSKLRLVNGPLLQIHSPAPNMRVSAPVTLRVEATGEEKADRIGYTLDGKPLGLFADHQSDVIWNPASVPAGRHLLGAVARLADGSLYTLDAVPLLIAPRLRALPFALGETLDLSTLNGKINVRADIDPTLNPRIVTYLVDKQIIAQRKEAPFDQAWWNPQATASGTHTLVVDVEDEAGKHVTSAPLSFGMFRRPGRQATTETPFIRARAAVNTDGDEVVESVESALLARNQVTLAVAHLPARLSIAAGTDIVLTGRFDEAKDIEIAAYVDSLRQTGYNGKGAFRLSIPTTNLTPGPHVLKVRLNYADGETRAVGQSHLLVYEKSPVQLRLPDTSVFWRQPVLLQATFALGFAPQAVTYYADGHALAPDPADPQRALWDPRSRQPGTHLLQAVATDADGIAFRSALQTVTIPVRIQAVPVEGVVVTATTRALPLRAALAEGLAPVLTVYQIDGATVAVQKRPPFDSATADVTNLPAGTHILTVQARDENDALYVSTGARFEVQNAAWTARRAVADAQLQGKFKEIAGRDRKKTAGALRGPIARAFAVKPEPRDGVIGHARGLAVLSFGNVPVIGRVIPIEASIRPGIGKFTFEADAAKDTRDSAQRALEYARQKTTQAGQGLDWARTDVLLRHPDKQVKTQGTSSSVADAVVLVSACLQMPIDRSVAITGALGASGQVGSVGGIVQKMDAVFNNPAIHTLILPADSLTEADLIHLTLQHPEQLTRRRIILARNMEEVLRQTLIGYSDAYDFAEELIQEGIGFYVNKDKAKALAALRQARELTPENATLSVWISLIQGEGGR